MHSLRRAVQGIARSCRRARVGLPFLAIAAMLVTGMATTAGAATPPTIDGNLNDLIQYVADLNSSNTGTGIDQADNAGDVVLTDATIVPCPAVVNQYFVNGYDQTRYLLARAGGSSDLYLGIRVAGIIGDTDGDGNPDQAGSGGANCNPDDNIVDQAGISAGETYQFQFDTQCAGAAANPCARAFNGGSGTITVTNNSIVGTGIFAGVTGQFAANGHDLELVLHNVTNLPGAFKVRTFVGSNTDGLSEDTGPVACIQPNPQIKILKSATPTRVCVGKTTRFTLTVQNTGNDDLANVAVEDDLPPGLTYAGNLSGTCGVTGQANGSAVTFSGFSLPFGASCTISFDALAGADCIGQVTNNASVVATAPTGGCQADLPAITDHASFDVVCVSNPCVTLDATGPQSACAGTKVTIQGSVANCSKDPETVVVTVNGAQAYNKQLAGGASDTWSLDTTMPQCTPGAPVNFAVHATANGECGDAPAQDKLVPVLCKNGPCVQAGALCDAGKGAQAACPGTPIQVTGSAHNCSTDVEDITITIEGVQKVFTAVVAGGDVNWIATIPMPACTAGAQVTFHVTATATNTCGSTDPSNASCSILCQGPQVEISKVADPAGAVDQGTTLHYTITVTNPSKTVGLDNVVVTDVLCSDVTFQGNSTPPTATAPAVGSTGTITWNLGSIAPGGVSTITFDAAVITLPSPACQATDRQCVNNVSVVGNCADAQATAQNSYTTPINACVAPGLCRLTGGGCLNEDGGNKGHKQNTFGGNASPLHSGGGPIGQRMGARHRDGKTILFNWHSHDAHVIACSDVPPGPCSPKADDTRADFVGTGQYSIGSGGRDQDGNMVAYIIDHTEGSCNKSVGDYYSIIVRTGLDIGQGAWCSDRRDDRLRQPADPRHAGRKFLNGALPGNAVDAAGAVTSSVALLNRAYPNPFAGSTNFAYKVANANTRVDVGVYNVAGRLVKTLASGVQSEGTYTLTWNGSDNSGVRLGRRVLPPFAGW